jgi:2'-5' RNA ligase
MTPEEEEKEKARVLYLSPEEKDQELRKLNREISRLEKLKGINTGEL